MSDLISREALLKSIEKAEPINLGWITDQITNAPAIEQGEAVIDKAAYDGAREDLSIWKRRALEAEEKVRKYDQRIVDIGVIAMTPVTTPQQTQSVADALEEAAVITWFNCMDYMKKHGIAALQDKELYKFVDDIRALIKRNEEGVE